MFMPQQRLREATITWTAPGGGKGTGVSGDGDPGILGTRRGGDGEDPVFFGGGRWRSLKWEIMSSLIKLLEVVMCPTGLMTANGD